MTDAPGFAEQATEAALHALGLRDLVERAEGKKIKRSAEEIEQMRMRLGRAEALASTIRHVAERAAARRGAA